MFRPRLPLVFACALSLTALSSLPAVHAQAGPSAEADASARQAFEAGQEAYDRGRFSEALAHFEHAYALSPRPKLLFNIGRAADSDLKTERAIEAYEAYLRAYPKADNREFVDARLTKLRELAGQRGGAPAAAPRGATSAPATGAPPPPYVSPPRGATPPPPAPAPYISGSSSTPVEQPERSEKSIPGFRMYGGFRLGGGGESTVRISQFGESPEVPFDLAATLGLQLGAGYAWRFFAIGGELRVSWMKFEDDSLEDFGRGRFVDLVVKPKLGYQLRSVPFEFYATLPVGLSVPEDGPLVGEDSGMSVDVGATVGFFIGASYFFTEHLGVNAELGWLGAWYNVDVGDYPPDDIDPSADVSISFSQWSPLTVNLMAAF